MWRWAVIVLCLVAAHVQIAQAGNLWCTTPLQSLGAGFACGASSPETGYCLPINSAAYSGVPQTSPSTVKGLVDLQFGATGMVAVGTACPGGSSIVVMNVSDYDAMINGADVVTKLQEGYELGTVALAILGVLAGFWFGYKAVQRRDSQ